MVKEIDFSKYIRNVSNFPQDGIQFKDITPLLNNGKIFSEAIKILSQKFSKNNITKVCAIESRGFILGSAIANFLKVGFVPIRKKNRLPFKIKSIKYELEYGKNEIEIHIDAFSKDDNVLLVDDLLATGGTVSAAISLIKMLNIKICGIVFLVELDFLNGRNKLSNYDIFSLIHFKE